MFEQILNSAREKIAIVNSSTELNQLKIEFLGKQSAINKMAQELRNLDAEKRKELGVQINNSRTQLQDLIAQKQIIIEKQELEKRFAVEALDLSVPARIRHKGTIHPITKCLEEIIMIFSALGFDIKDGPNIETDWYNFTALNIAENHPARQMHDTFYLNNIEKQDVMLLRTHTSPVQIRTMQNGKPPFRFIAPGRTYRSDSDMTHTPMFHQVEGVAIDQDIHMGHMKHTIIAFIKRFFESADIEIRFRPSFFPFTEPSAEVDIRLNNDSKWLEILGCGMVHPKVLQNSSLNPSEYQGFAFGLGVERLAMLKYGIKDLRQFFEGDIRWIKNYGFHAFDLYLD